MSLSLDSSHAIKIISWFKMFLLLDSSMTYSYRSSTKVQDEKMQGEMASYLKPQLSPADGIFWLR